MNYTHLSAEERMKLYQLKQEQFSNRVIARHLGRSPSTICRELKRNQSQAEIYLPDTAQVKMQQRRQAAKTPFSSIPGSCIAQVKARLQQYHSPQQIAGRLKREGQPVASYETIYQMIYQNYEDMGLYAQYLRQSHIRRQKRSSKQSKRGMIPSRIGIEQRPSIAAEKTQIGHWEGDTIIGGNHLGAIATHVDKASKFLVARVMKTRTSAEMNRVSIAAFTQMSADKRRTFTFDNGKEFSGHQQLAEALNVHCFLPILTILGNED